MFTSIQFIGGSGKDMKAWFKTHAALERTLSNPRYAMALARTLQELRFKDGETAKQYRTPEAQVRAWQGYYRDMEDAHVFEFPDDVALLMTLTDNEPREVKLPFPIVWLDVEFDLPGESGMLHYQGILIYDKGLPVTFENEPTPKILEGINPAIVFLATNQGVVEVVAPIGVDPKKTFKDATGHVLTWSKLGRREHHTFTNIVMNFLDLLDTPDVFIVPVRRKHLQQSRESKGLPPLPVSDKVVLQASIRRYIDQLKTTGKFRFSHRFWVRGHWRHYRDERYRNLLMTDVKRAIDKTEDRDHPKWKQVSKELHVGKCSDCHGKEWIKPFIKGQGILVKKRYVPRR